VESKGSLQFNPFAAPSLNGTSIDIYPINAALNSRCGKVWQAMQSTISPDPKSAESAWADYREIYLKRTCFEDAMG
jgi:hypothetical protein